MVAEFRARMVGRVAVLQERWAPVPGLACRSDILTEDGPMSWVNQRYPHLKLKQLMWDERPELFCPENRTPPSAQRGNKRREVFAVEFENDDQAMEFKLRWV